MPLFLTFYGDEFTGSTDAFDVLAAAGVETILYLTAPSEAQIAAHASARAVGFAGVSRSQSAAWMEKELPSVFARMKALGAPVAHCKVCSTFDSAPRVGGPELGRYVLFGNLFATALGVTYRIDRHPLMSRHPTTPIDEADLRLHLARQTALSCDLLDHVALTTRSPDELRRRLAERQARLVVLDTVDAATPKGVGRLLWHETPGEALFVVGSSGVDFSLVERRRELGPAPTRALDPAERVVVLSGSCSRINAGQIGHALAHGFEGVALESDALIAGGGAMEATARRVVDLLAHGRSPLLYTALGPVARPRADADAIAFNTMLGERPGVVFRDIISRSVVKRGVVAGGDTSDHVTSQLGLYALSYRAALTRGCPLCLAHSSAPEFEGRELALKGG